MTENRSGPRSRTQRLYAARGMNPAEAEAPIPTDAVQPNMPEEEQRESYADYTPNEPVEARREATPTADFSAYYRPGGAGDGAGEEPAFAPPPKLDFAGYEAQPWGNEPQDASAGNVYHPRAATWADTARRGILSADDLGYQVREEPPRKSRRGKRLWRALLAVLAGLVLLVGAGWLLRGQIAQWLGMEGDGPAPTAEVFEAVTTPQPVKGYDAAPSVEIAQGTQAAIAKISGTVNMETYAVTDTHVITRTARAEGNYDYYVFTAAEGRLLCYFEGLGPQGVLPQEGGGFYVEQRPYLVGAGGSALIRTADLESLLGSEVRLHPLYHGWSIAENMATGAVNYLNGSGQTLSTLWFCRAFPFTGEYSLAYVDTGGTADPEQRYLLYVLGADGTMSRWLAAMDTRDVAASALGMAYMSDGRLYRLPDTSAPVVTSDRVDAYLDCDAMVVRDPQSGKYGLFVHGEQHYDFAYDSIRPVESDMQWAESTLDGEGGSFTIHAVTGAAYPQPLSHSFVLERDGQSEYVALSTQSVYPIRLDGEF